MRTPLYVFRHYIAYLTSMDKWSLLRHFTEFLTGLAPLMTLLIITLLTHFTYHVSVFYLLTCLLQCNLTFNIFQLLVQSWLRNVTLVFFMVQLFGNWIIFYTTKSFINKSEGNRYKFHSSLLKGVSTPVF